MRIKSKTKFNIYIGTSLCIFLVINTLIFNFYFKYDDLPSDWATTVALDNYAWRYGHMLDCIISILLIADIYVIFQIILGFIYYNKLKKATVEKHKIYYKRHHPNESDEKEDDFHEHISHHHRYSSIG